MGAVGGEGEGRGRRRGIEMMMVMTTTTSRWRLLVVGKTLCIFNSGFEIMDPRELNELECEDLLYLASFIGMKLQICVFSWRRFFCFVFVTFSIHVFGGSIGVEVRKKFAQSAVSERQEGET